MGRMVATRGWGGSGNEELLFNGNRVSVIQDEKSYGYGWR